jgi:hypothetical protein
MQDFGTIWQEISRWPAERRLTLARRLLASLQDELGPSTAQGLGEMAADPQVQSELAAIAQEFAPTEEDGLEEPRP